MCRSQVGMTGAVPGPAIWLPGRFVELGGAAQQPRPSELPTTGRALPKMHWSCAHEWLSWSQLQEHTAQPTMLRPASLWGLGMLGRFPQDTPFTSPCMHGQLPICLPNLTKQDMDPATQAPTPSKKLHWAGSSTRTITNLWKKFSQIPMFEVWMFTASTWWCGNHRRS